MSARPILQALEDLDYKLLKELGTHISIYEQEKALTIINKKKLPNNEYKKGEKDNHPRTGARYWLVL